MFAKNHDRCVYYRHFFFLRTLVTYYYFRLILNQITQTFTYHFVEAVLLKLDYSPEPVDHEIISNGPSNYSAEINLYRVVYYV